MKLHQVSKVPCQLLVIRICNVVLILDEILDLIIVVIFQSLCLACLEVLHVELGVLIVLDHVGLEEAGVTGLQDVAQVEEAHGLKLHTFEVQVDHGLIEGGG